MGTSRVIVYAIRSGRNYDVVVAVAGIVADIVAAIVNSGSGSSRCSTNGAIITPPL